MVSAPQGKRKPQWGRWVPCGKGVGGQLLWNLDSGLLGNQITLASAWVLLSHFHQHFRPKEAFLQIMFLPAMWGGKEAARSSTSLGRVVKLT